MSECWCLSSLQDQFCVSLVHLQLGLCKSIYAGGTLSWLPLYTDRCLCVHPPSLMLLCVPSGSWMTDIHPILLPAKNVLVCSESHSLQDQVLSELGSHASRHSAWGLFRVRQLPLATAARSSRHGQLSYLSFDKSL